MEELKRNWLILWCVGILALGIISTTAIITYHMRVIKMAQLNYEQGVLAGTNGTFWIKSK